MKGFKAFIKVKNKLKCRGFSFEPNKTYSTNEKLMNCKYDFYFCEKLSDIFNYYEFDKNNVEIREVESMGEIVIKDEKIVTNKIKIGKEVSLENWFYNEEMQLKAVKRNCHNIRFIEKPSEKMQLEAVKRHKSSVNLIKNPTKKVIELANK